MKVSSPIGELPFEPRAVRLRGNGIQVDGVMGAWPAQVTITAGDLPGFARVAARPAIVGAVGLTTVLGLIRLTRSNRHHH
jgi:hypothetical protein